VRAAAVCAAFVLSVYASPSISLARGLDSNYERGAFAE